MNNMAGHTAQPGHALRDERIEAPLLKRIAELEREVAHWKNNHATEVRRARVLKERPDIPLERVQAYAQIEELHKTVAAKQAEIDRLMLEFCPDEMTDAQIDEWAKHQVPAEMTDAEREAIKFAKEQA